MKAKVSSPVFFEGIVMKSLDKKEFEVKNPSLENPNHVTDEEAQSVIKSGKRLVYHPNDNLQSLGLVSEFAPDNSQPLRF